MPELHAYYGYPAVWLVMLAVTAAMFFFFRSKGWLSSLVPKSRLRSRPNPDPDEQRTPQS
jgi:hypothetical protein